MAFQKYTMRSVRETCSKSRREPLVKSQSNTLRPLAESSASHWGQVQKEARPPSFGPKATPSSAGLRFNSSTFSLAIAVIRSRFDLHNLARSGWRDWSREPFGWRANQSGWSLPYLAHRWPKAWPPLRFKLPPSRCQLNQSGDSAWV